MLSVVFQVRRYITEENRYAEDQMQHTRSLQETLYKELVMHMKEEDMTPMEKIDRAVGLTTVLVTESADYYYYQRFVPGKQYPIFCRKRGSPNALEQVEQSSFLCSSLSTEFCRLCWTAMNLLQGMLSLKSATMLCLLIITSWHSALMFMVHYLSYMLTN